MSITVRRATQQRLVRQVAYNSKLHEYANACVRYGRAHEAAIQEVERLRGECKDLLQSLLEAAKAEGMEAMQDEDVQDWETERKPHVQVDQHYYYDYIKDYGPQTIETLAAAFDVHPGTARRMLDGLVFQGKLRCDRRRPIDTSLYELVD